MLFFAYDGSLNGDWVAHYAVRFAANTSSRKLRLIHIAEASPVSHLEDRIARIAAESKLLGVVLEMEIAPCRRANVAQTLLEIVPERSMLIAGTRAKPRQHAFLGGTVSARLLQEGLFSVIAMRVMHPGVLGQPGSVLLPIAGRNQQAEFALPLLHLLGADLQRLHLLYVREVSGPRVRFMSPAVTQKLLAEGRALVAPIEDEIRAGLAPHPFLLDSSVVVADDVPMEILLCANRHHSRLIALGASQRTLAQRIAFGNPIEHILRDSPSDVAVYRSVP